MERCPTCGTPRFSRAEKLAVVIALIAIFLGWKYLRLPGRGGAMSPEVAVTETVTQTVPVSPRPAPATHLSVPVASERIRISKIGSDDANEEAPAEDQDSTAELEDLPEAHLPNEWKVSGGVFDLISMKPLAGCSITFTNQGGNRKYEIRTNASGHYKIRLPPLDEQGYEVVIAKAGYTRTFMDASAASLKTMSRAQRVDMAGNLLVTPQTAPQVRAYDEPVAADFYLAPQH